MGTRLEFLAVTVGTVLIAHTAQAADTPRNVILFVRHGINLFCSLDCCGQFVIRQAIAPLAYQC